MWQATNKYTLLTCYLLLSTNYPDESGFSPTSPILYVTSWDEIVKNTMILSITSTPPHRELMAWRVVVWF